MTRTINQEVPAELTEDMIADLRIRKALRDKRDALWAKVPQRHRVTGAGKYGTAYRDASEACRLQEWLFSEKWGYAIAWETRYWKETP